MDYEKINLTEAPPNPKESPKVIMSMIKRLLDDSNGELGIIIEILEGMPHGQKKLILKNIGTLLSGTRISLEALGDSDFNKTHIKELGGEERLELGETEIGEPVMGTEDERDETEVELDMQPLVPDTLEETGGLNWLSSHHGEIQEDDGSVERFGELRKLNLLDKVMIQKYFDKYIKPDNFFEGAENIYQEYFDYVNEQVEKFYNYISLKSDILSEEQKSLIDLYVKEHLTIEQDREKKRIQEELLELERKVKNIEKMLQLENLQKMPEKDRDEMEKTMRKNLTEYTGQIHTLKQSEQITSDEFEKKVRIRKAIGLVAMKPILEHIQKRSDAEAEDYNQVFKQTRDELVEFSIMPASDRLLILGKYGMSDEDLTTLLNFKYVKKKTRPWKLAEYIKSVNQLVSG